MTLKSVLTSLVEYLFARHHLSQDAPRMSDADFVKAIADDEWSTAQIVAAHKLRQVIAGLSGVFDEEILPQHTFHANLAKHGFWKSDYDLFELSRVIYDAISIDISGRVPGCHTTFELIERPDITVSSFIRSIVTLIPGEAARRGR